MSVTIRHPSATRSRSASLWGKVPLSVKLGETGNYYFDDFHKLPTTGVHTITQATAGTIAMDDVAGGVILADCGDTTQGHGVNLQLGGTNGESFALAVTDNFLFECRIKLAAITSGLQAFIGLANTDTSIIASNAISTTDHLGFYVSGATAAFVLAASKASAATTKALPTTPLVTATWYKLAILIKQGSIYHYLSTSGAAPVEGDSSTVLAASTYMPTAEVRPSIVLQGNGTAQPTMQIDWWGFAQW